MRADRRDPVIASLRKFKPAKFEVELADGSRRAVALSDKQNKWELLSDTLEALDWLTISALAQDGTVLGTLQSERDEEDDEDDEAGLAELTQLGRILERAVAGAMGQMRMVFAETLRGYQALVTSSMDTTRQLQQLYTMMLRQQLAQLQAGNSNAAGAGGAEDEADSVLKMLQMATMLGNLSKTGNGAPPAPAAAGG